MATIVKPESMIQPGLLQVFRLFAAGRVGLLLISWAALPFARAGAPARHPQYGLVEAGLLLLLLIAPVKRSINERYLMGMVWLAGLGPVISYAAAVRSRLVIADQGQVISDIWQLILVMLVPLLLASWQFRLRQVVFFIAGTSFVDGLVTLAAARGSSDILVGMLALNFVRMLLFLLVGYIVVRLMDAQRQQQKALERVNLSLAEANRRIARNALTLEQLATSRERNRLARELHDTLAHTLSATAVQLEAAQALWDTDAAQARSMLQQSLEATRSGLNEARLAIRALRADPLETLGLGLALRQEAESTAARAGMILRFQAVEIKQELSAEVEQVVYRVACEALANAAHHSRATNLEVTLNCDDNQLSLRVEDDGQGFDSNAPVEGGHFGLTGMRERAQIVGGRLTITSSPGRGTRIILEVDIKP